MFTKHTDNSILYLRSDALDSVPHGFSTRLGGVSPAPWDSLNLGVGRGDAMDNVRENYRRFCAVLGLNAHRAVLSKQIHEDVVRPVSIRMRYLDENFVEHDEEFSGYPARVIQHEYDHLEGKVFTDHLSPLRRNLLKSKILKLAKGQYRCNYKTK